MIEGTQTGGVPLINYELRVYDNTTSDWILADLTAATTT